MDEGENGTVKHGCVPVIHFPSSSAHFLARRIGLWREAWPTQWLKQSGCLSQRDSQHQSFHFKCSGLERNYPAITFPLSCLSRIVLLFHHLSGLTQHPPQVLKLGLMCPGHHSAICITLGKTTYPPWESDSPLVKWGECKVAKRTVKILIHLCRWVNLVCTSPDGDSTAVITTVQILKLWPIEFKSIGKCHRANVCWVLSAGPRQSGSRACSLIPHTPRGPGSSQGVTLTMDPAL